MDIAERWRRFMYGSGWADKMQEELATVAFDGVVIAEIDADHYKDIGVGDGEGRGLSVG